MLKDEVARLEGELKSRNQGMETLMVDKADLVNEVMNWEAEAITAKDSLKEVELTRGLDFANAVDEALTKFKNSNEFSALLKKGHDAGFDAEVKAIFYNIWAHYRDLYYAFLGGKLTDLIGEWLEEEMLNAPNVVPSSIPLVLRLEMLQILRLCQLRLISSNPLLRWTRRLQILILLLLSRIPLAI